MYTEPRTYEQECAPIKAGVVIREASFDDYPGISRLSSRQGLPTKSYVEWEHFWTANPTYNCITDWPIGWVIEADEIVGYLGNIPRKYDYAGRYLVAAASHGLAVDPNYRNYSLTLIGHFYRQTQAELLLNTSANFQAAQAYRVFRATQVPVGDWNRALYWITDYCGFVDRVLSTKKVPMASLVSIPVGGFMHLKDSIARKPIPPSCSCRVCTYDFFDERFDAFWKEAVRQSGGRLLATRSREILDWHFQCDMSSGRTWLATVEDRSGLIAYAVFCRQDSPGFGLTRVRLVDFQALCGRTELLVPLIGWGLDKCREQRVHMLEAIGFAHRKQEILQSLASYRRALPSWLYFYKANNTTLAQALFDPQIWDPCCFDGDSSL
jgi:hypothetical protein